MTTVSAFEAKTHMGRILDLVSRGEEVLITRYDKPVARMVPEGQPSLRAVREAVEGLRAMRFRQKRAGRSPLTDARIRDAINAGRP